ncbi:hypothetical protein TWF102_011168 [Orbilia oligospora]|uniref:Uncharacterized protein n=1 Tax=Orbilia oligospora TaxID=2813651 RepID=A0A7C8J924_ORBOL|nr:hypothetical protein TWF102_011168 [Orbilia oligospora]
MHIFRFSILVTAFITFVSLCAARTVITLEKCTTRSCGVPVKVHRTTKTDHVTARYTITRWKKTVTVPAKIVTVVDTKPAWKTKTVTASTVTKEIYITTGERRTEIVIRTKTISSVIATLPVITRTIRPQTVVIPAPSGVYGVNQDPANKAGQTITRRNAEPEPTPGAAKKYPSAVVCTKTLLTKTGTTDIWKTTTKKKGTKTVSKSYTTSTRTKTVTVKNPKIITKIAGFITNTTSITTSTTITTRVTLFEKTVTEILPTPTFYAACGASNRVPPPDFGTFWLVGGPGYSDDEPTIYTEGDMSPHDCCVSCWTLPASKGKCIGSVHYYLGLWGDPNCDWEHDEDCGVPPPGEPTAGCRLILESKKGVCRTSNYYFYVDVTNPPIVFSNGPGCLRYKYKPLH